MKYALLCLLLVGCGDSGELAALKASLRTSEETIVAASSATVEKQDATIAVLKENTAALGLLKTSVEKLTEASLAKSEPQTGKDGDPASAPEPPAKANDTQTPSKVATPGASRLTSDGTRLRWNIEGNWDPTILETSAHLGKDHGINTDGMTHQEMADLHAALHDGKPVAMKAKVVRAPLAEWIGHGTSTYYPQSSCPGGVCPVPQRVSRRGKR